jgi:hypothetical protein
MKRRRSPGTAEQDPPASAVAVHAVVPTGVYFVDTFRKLFRLRKSTVRREVREGRLRIAKRAGRYYLLGKWVLQWLEEGELPRRHGPTKASGSGTAGAGPLSCTEELEMRPPPGTLGGEEGAP